MALGRFLVLLAFLVGGLALAGFGWTTYQNQQSDIQQAVTVEGTIERTDVVFEGSNHSSGSGHYEVVIRYTYTYDGQEYTSESVYPGPEKQFGDKRNARAVADRYSPGQTTTVYVNRERPSRAFLIEEKSNFMSFIAMGLGGLLALAMGSGLVKEIVGGGPDG